MNLLSNFGQLKVELVHAFVVLKKLISFNSHEPILKNKRPHGGRDKLVSVMETAA